MLAAEKIDSLIRSGRIQEAREILSAVSLSHLAREEFATFANLARRCGFYDLSLRLLNPLIRNEKKLLSPPKPIELAEYAMSLIKIGSIVEGRKILLEIDLNRCPQAKFFLGLSYLHEWDYRSAARLIEEYLELDSIDPYQRALANVNLCAAYISNGEGDSAQKILLHFIPIAEKSHFRLLLGNLFELNGQLSIQKKSYQEAFEHLKKSTELLNQSSMAYELFAQKWMCVIALQEKPKSESTAELIQSTREKATHLKHWETLRDLDFHLASQRRDVSLFHQLYFGTPYQAYKEKLLQQFSDLPQPPKTLLWKSSAAEQVRQTFDPAQLSHRKVLANLFMTLASDLYHPLSIGRIAAGVFPDEYYNPNSTPNRIHQAITRLRRTLSEVTKGVEIAENSGTYSLALDSGIGILLNQASASMPDPLFEALSPGELITAKELSEKLGCSLSSATRKLNELINQGTIEKIGQGRASQYRVANKKAA